MTTTVTKGLVVRSDLQLYDGKYETVNRRDSTGGTINSLPINDFVDVLSVYGSGSEYTVVTITSCVNNLGSRNRTILFRQGTWEISENLTIASNFTSYIPAGCVFNVASGKTLTFSGPVMKESYTWTSGSGTVVANEWLTPSAFMATVLNDATAAAARATLGSTAVGDAVFIAATAAAARTTLDAMEDILTTIGDGVIATTAGAAARIAAKADVAAHATTANPWVSREVVLTGVAVTFTDIADAPYVGAVVWVKQNAAHIWTDGAVFDVQGGMNYTAAAGDWIRVYATTVSTFEVTIYRALSNAQGTFTATLTGCTTSPTVTASYSVTNNVATVFYPAVTATSNTTALTLTGAPAAIRPATARTIGVFTAADNAANLYARVDLGTDGVITAFTTADGTAWTGSGTKGFPQGLNLTYNLA